MLSIEEREALVVLLIEILKEEEENEAEEEILSDIRPGQHRSLFIPATASYIRIRILETGFQKQKITDQQIRYLNGRANFCYLLAHGARHPVYGLCPGSYAEMLAEWEH